MKKFYFLALLMCSLALVSCNDKKTSELDDEDVVTTDNPMVGDWIVVDEQDRPIRDTLLYYVGEMFTESFEIKKYPCYTLYSYGKNGKVVILQRDGYIKDNIFYADQNIPKEALDMILMDGVPIDYKYEDGYVSHIGINTKVTFPDKNHVQAVKGYRLMRLAGIK